MNIESAARVPLRERSRSLALAIVRSPSAPMSWRMPFGRPSLSPAR